MMPNEKSQLLSLLDHEHRWCQNTEAQDANGNAARYDETVAVAWDLTGALCRLFGWRRASELFGQLDRHINGRHVVARRSARQTVFRSMAALQDFNDRGNTTFEMVRGQIETMPVRDGPPHRVGLACNG
jgi:hypothetical protein